MVAYSFQKRFVDPIKAGLGTYEPILGLQPAVVKPKRQTIRAVGKRRHAEVGDYLQLYFGMRTKQCSQIGVAKCIVAAQINITFLNSGAGKIEISGEDILDQEIRTKAGLDEFAQGDGFMHWRDMREFWMKTHGLNRPFCGMLIRWEPIK